MFRRKIFISLFLITFFLFLSLTASFAEANPFLDGYRHGVEHRLNIVKSLLWRRATFGRVL